MKFDEWYDGYAKRLIDYHPIEILSYTEPAYKSSIEKMFKISGGESMNKEKIEELTIVLQELILLGGNLSLHSMLLKQRKT